MVHRFSITPVPEFAQRPSAKHQSDPCCSLSLRERVRVRGKYSVENAKNSISRGVLSRRPPRSSALLSVLATVTLLLSLSRAAKAGAVLADIDGDGDLDLLVNSMGGGTRIFENDGKGHFKEVTAQAGVASKTAGMSMALGDVDGDGNLDLYVTNFRSSTIREEPNT